MRSALLAVGVALVLSSGCDDDLAGEEADDPGDLPRAGTEELSGEGPRAEPAAAPVAEVLVDDAALASELRIAGDRLYWVASGGAGYQLRSVAASGGPVTTDVELGALAPIDLVLTGGQVYWTSAGRRAGRLQRAPIDGGGPAEVVYRDGAAAPTALAASSKFLYFGAADGCVRRFGEATGIEPVSCAAGTPVVIAPGEPDVFWGTAEGALYRAPADGGPADRRIAGESFQSRLYIDDTSVYWLNAYARAVQVMERDAHGAKPLAAAQYAPVGMAMDGAHVYFTTQSDQSVKRVAKVSSPVDVLAGEQSDPADIVLYADRAYWINEGDGTIMTLSIR
ncbi:MAG TPA: hypothetical protein VIG06_05250 [Kofleriaceae bacterium]